VESAALSPACHESDTAGVSPLTAAPWIVIIVRKTGAGDGTRTRDLLITNQVVFETAGADANGWPVSWTEQKRLAWDAAVPLVDVQVELKAATTGATANPGLVTFDHVEITRY
jgi:hypothetical protein